MRLPRLPWSVPCLSWTRVRRPSASDRNIFGSPTVLIGVSLRNMRLTSLLPIQMMKRGCAKLGRNVKQKRGRQRPLPRGSRPDRRGPACLGRSPIAEWWWSSRWTRQGLLVPATIVQDGVIWQTHALCQIRCDRSMRLRTAQRINMSNAAKCSKEHCASIVVSSAVVFCTS